mmetsp:Transcript_32475/g.80530  ORF Transcript_32475/g.80530 Transcript_32475/m.80530 type:complete len:283 (-) Transcript_32475:71-919(-)
MLMKALEAAAQNGRVDAVIQSTDKNLLVPVGGAIVAAFGRGPGAVHSKALLAAVASSYAGRASAAPIVDAFVTMLYMGAQGYAKLVAEREANMQFLAEAVGKVAEAHGERLLVSAANPISIAVTLGGCLCQLTGPPGQLADPGAAGDGAVTGVAALRASEYTAFGAQLFKRLCSGTRVVVPTERKTIDGILIIGFGAHVPAYPHVYFTVAAALGQTRDEINVFARRLDAVFREFEKAHVHRALRAAGTVPVCFVAAPAAAESGGDAAGEQNGDRARGPGGIA